MRLTLDLIVAAPQYMNPCKDRMISLRGYKIPTIENLGATRDQFDCIDLCDNDLIKVHNIPQLRKLKVLLLANNRISRIAPDAFTTTPNLTSLILTNNKIERLSDLYPLREAKKLERLSLGDNTVTSIPLYREFVIFLIPTLRYLDFQKISEAIRNDAVSVFDSENGKQLLASIAPVSENETATPDHI